MTPEFSRRAAAVINSPYFSMGRGLERIQQKVALRKALAAVKSFKELPPELLAIARLAHQSIGAAP